MRLLAALALLLGTALGVFNRDTAASVGRTAACGFVLRPRIKFTLSAASVGRTAACGFVLRPRIKFTLSAASVGRTAACGFVLRPRIKFTLIS
ncbi:hypothetical protein RSM1_27060, partial [Methylobacterium radiotolerans]